MVGTIGRGQISSISGNHARVVVPERTDSITAPLIISAGALDSDGKAPPPGTDVAFIEFVDGHGAIIARLSE